MRNINVSSNAHSIVISDSKIIIDGKEIKNIEEDIKKGIHIHVKGSKVELIESKSPLIIYGNVEIIKTEGSVECENVEGNIIAKGSVNCGNVKGNVSSNSSVSCDNVGGNVTALNSVDCDNIEGDVSAEIINS